MVGWLVEQLVYSVELDEIHLKASLYLSFKWILLRRVKLYNKLFNISSS